MKRILAFTSIVGLMLVLMAARADAQAVSTDKLERAGWTCLDQGPELPTPCLPDAGSVESGEAAASIIMTFGPDGEFLGTEHLIHEDLYNGQPCPQDNVTGGDGSYIYLEPVVGLEYYVCHHFDSPFT